MASIAQQTVSVPSSSWNADTIVVTPGDQTVQVASANPERRSVTIINSPDSPGVLFLTPNTGAKRGGIKLIPGAGYELATAAAIYGYAVGGACDVNVIDLTGTVC